MQILQASVFVTTGSFPTGKRGIVRPSFEQLQEELFGRLFVEPTSYENVEDIAIPIHRSLEIMAFAGDGEGHLVQVLLAPRSGMPVAQLIGIGLPELAAPIPHRFIGQDDAAGGHGLLNAPVTEAEVEV